MFSILKEKKKLFLSLILIWTIAAFYVYPRRFEFLRTVALWLEPPELNPSLSAKLQAKGDELLSEKVEFRQVEHYLRLDKMSQSCVRASELGKQGMDDIFRVPSWMEAKNEGWTLEQLGNLSGSKLETGGKRIDPFEYWQEFSSLTLESLDYYKRALNYNPFDGYNSPSAKVDLTWDKPPIAGKGLLEKIKLTSFASCRPEEALLAHFQSILRIEEFVFEKIRTAAKPVLPWWKRILNFFSFSCKKEEEELGEEDLPKEIRIWNSIAGSESNPMIFSEDYPETTRLTANKYKRILLNTLELLRMKGGASSLSPEESVSLYTRVLFFSCSKRNIPAEAKYWGPTAIATLPCDPSDEEGSKVFYSNLFRAARLYYRLGERDSQYRKKAGEMFESVFKSKSTDLGVRFQAKLMRVRCLLFESKWDEALRELDGLDTEVYTVDPNYRNDKSGYEDLIEDKKKLLQYVLRRKGRYEEADDIFDETN
ncbi:hypothetical protein EHQ27_12575 [Leptospira wolffii]|uniref:hypothetical protein n=1 Tax=Leptospira wolffii TaxID=409998 RepID=UPI001082600B|nr:hypothetical protein [Leptospira wolffii]TGK59960.1 hypothetical protein EHQ32_08590 [Leptospira wolffii]TGK70050.1 hypothetical protein EHQ27_12575 [Leptospira wolffii]TGK75968.1 hypothetical protein EHQ35_01340 [Leptospira wolffii]TGL30219.1 hypothetical protein EHQ57_07310 [Leptospira wolffii]